MLTNIAYTSAIDSCYLCNPCSKIKNLCYLCYLCDLTPSVRPSNQLITLHYSTDFTLYAINYTLGSAALPLVQRTLIAICAICVRLKQFVHHSATSSLKAC